MSVLVQRLERRQVPLYLGGLAAGALVGLTIPRTAGAFQAAIYPVLGALLYVTFLQIPFVELRAALGDRRFVAAALALNFVLVPPVAFGLSRWAPGGRAIEVGVLMVLLAPCVDYVIAFTRLAGGSAHKLLAATPLLMLAQMALLPAYLVLFMGPGLGGIIDRGPLVRAFVALIAVPLVLAWATQRRAAISPVAARLRARLDLAPVALMTVTLLVVTASQLPRVRDDIGQIAGVVPIYAAFLIVMAAVGLLLGRGLRFDAATARALLFTGATRNSLVVLPLALSISDANRLSAAVIVTQTLVEVLGMVVLVHLVPRLIPLRRGT